ncbi:Cathelicidin-B1 [Eumeta japonica]|uniref:Cathelicidin-B1 n=1 Tax=Eumeta variegata TaxID=151549 RepID=A0A4C2A616_EUMVA|nr:Cathelicidin-B1 [Eumeta japonica]
MCVTLPLASKRATGSQRKMHIAYDYERRKYISGKSYLSGAVLYCAKTIKRNTRFSYSLYPQVPVVQACKKHGGTLYSYLALAALLPTSFIRCTCESSQRSSFRCFTLLMCVPRLRWMFAQFTHINIPKFLGANLGPKADLGPVVGLDPTPDLAHNDLYCSTNFRPRHKTEGSHKTEWIDQVVNHGPYLGPALDSDLSSALDSNPRPALDPNPSPALDSDLILALDSNPSPALDSDLSPALDSDLSTALDSNPSPALDSDLSPALDFDPSPALYSDPSPALDSHPSRTLDPDSGRDIDITSRERNGE